MACKFLGDLEGKKIICYYEAKKILPFSFWRILSLCPFRGLKLNLLFFIIRFIIGAKIYSYVWALANCCFVLLKHCCNFLTLFSGTSCAGRIAS